MAYTTRHQQGPVFPQGRPAGRSGTSKENIYPGHGDTTSSTSKVAIVSKSSRQGFDVDYTFAQIGVDKPIVEFSGNCGNISSAVGPFAVDEGMVNPREPITQ